MRGEIVIVILSLAASARAQPAPDEAPADVAFQKGRTALEAGDAAEACEQFQVSFKHAPDSPATMLNLGLCNEALGRTASALRWFRRAQVRGSETGNADFEDAAKRKTLALADRVPTFRIEIVDAPPGAVPMLNGAPMNELELARIEVDPGKHVFEVLVEGQRAMREEAQIEDGQKRTMRLVVPKLVKTTRRLVVLDPGAKQRRNAYLLGGASIAMFAGAAVISVAAYNAFHDTEHPVQQEKWRNRLNFGGGGLAIAGTLAASAAIYFYLEAPRKRRVEQNVIAAPLVAPDRVGVSLSGSF